jgi:hypothetical protein
VRIHALHDAIDFSREARTATDRKEAVATLRKAGRDGSAEMNRGAAIESALRCFTCGLLALVPLLGLPFAVTAVILYTKSSRHSADDWHPARRYALLGLTFALVGSFVTITALFCTVIFHLEDIM